MKQNWQKKIICKEVMRRAMRWIQTFSVRVRKCVKGSRKMEGGMYDTREITLHVRS